MRRTLLPLLLVTALTAVPAAAATINFESDTTGNKPNGFVSVDSAIASFTDTLGTDLLLGVFFESNNTNGLATFGDDTSRLRIDFSAYQSSLAMDFGNDHLGFANPGDRAWLQLFDGVTLVGTVSVDMNLDDLMNQTISYTGAAFNNALLWYGTSAGAPIGLIEVVDNIRFDDQNVVPEPASLMLLGGGLLGLASRRRKKLSA